MRDDRHHLLPIAHCVARKLRPLNYTVRWSQSLEHPQDKSAKSDSDKVDGVSTEPLRRMFGLAGSAGRTR